MKMLEMAMATLQHTLPVQTKHSRAVTGQMGGSKVDPQSSQDIPPMSPDKYVVNLFGCIY